MRVIDSFIFLNILFFCSSNKIESKHARINLNFTLKAYTMLSTVFIEMLSALLLPIFFFKSSSVTS